MNSIHDWIEKIEQQSDTALQWQMILRAFASYGFDHIMFVHGDVRQEITVLSSIEGSEWHDYYYRLATVGSDPILRICASTYRTMRTGLDHLDHPALTSGERRIAHQAMEAGAGFRSGFTCTIEAFRGGRVSVWNIASQMGHIEVDKILAEHGMALQHLCFVAQRILFTKQLATLSERERQVLYLLACRGLRHQEIADALFIALPTVRFHLANIREKFGVKTIEQAIAIAVEADILRV